MSEIPKITPRLLIGVFLVALGVLFLLENLGYADVEHYFDFWPLVLVAIGATKWVQARSNPARMAAGLWILVGVWLILYNVDLVPYAFWDLWPLVLILVGVWVIWQTMERSSRRESDVDPASTVSALAIWSGADRKSSSTDFRGGELTAIMGGCELDLSQARIVEGEAVLDLFAFWGGIEIRVPRDWKVVSEVTAFMGAYEQSADPAPADATQRLVLRGLAVMGAIEVKN
jgi:predicted membrane protein